jgi:hypothetical protein
MNVVTQYSPLPLQLSIYTGHATNRMLQKTLLSISPSVNSSQSVGSMKQPRISSLSSQFLILEKRRPELNRGSRVDMITRISKSRRQRVKNAPVHCRAEDPRTRFPETEALRKEPSVF